MDDDVGGDDDVGVASEDVEGNYLQGYCYSVSPRQQSDHDDHHVDVQADGGRFRAWLVLFVACLADWKAGDFETVFCELI